MSSWIYTDADNTLWDTDALFATAQLTLLEAAEDYCGLKGPATGRLEFVRSFDQAIAERHHQQLRYPPALLVRALCDGLKGTAPEVAAHRALTEGAIPAEVEAIAIRGYSGVVSSIPQMLDGVKQGLELAKDRGAPVYVVSEGPLDTVRARLKAHGLERLITGALSAQKSRDLYVRLKLRAESPTVVMIGDQPDRDVRLAHEAGLRTVLVQGRFQPRWINAIDTNYADAVVQDFSEAVSAAMEFDSLPPA